MKYTRGLLALLYLIILYWILANTVIVNKNHKEVKSLQIPKGTLYLQVNYKDLYRCIKQVSNTIISLREDIEEPTKYVNSLSSFICEYTLGTEIDPLKIVSILYLESRLYQMPRDNNNLYLPSPSNDYGPMQINSIHTPNYGEDFKKDLRENIRVGIDIFKTVNQSFSNYNGSRKKDIYNKKAHYIYQRIIKE